MQEAHFDLTTADGDMPTWTFHPDEGTHPVVLFLMDAPGMRQEIRTMASRLATSGYYVMTSQLYYRQVREFNVFETGDRDRMFELMNALSNDMVDADNGALLDHARQDPAADASKVGVVGYCMSGPFAITTAAAHNDCVRAAASFHGVRLQDEGIAGRGHCDVEIQQVVQPRCRIAASQVEPRLHEQQHDGKDDACQRRRCPTWPMCSPGRSKKSPAL